MTIKSFIKNQSNSLTILIFTIIIALLIYYNPYKIISNYSNSFIFIISLILVIITSLITYKNSNKNTNYQDLKEFFIKIIFFISFVFIFIFSLFFLTYLIINFNFSLNIFIYSINLLIIIGILALFFKFFEYALKINNVEDNILLEFLLNIIFYIPCLFIDLIEFLKYQYKITSKTIWIIFIIEIILISIRILLPILYKLYIQYFSYSYIIEEGPIYLEKKKVVGVFENLDNLDISSNYNFAISCKIWINPQPKSTSSAYNKQTPLLNYGDIIVIYYNKNKLEIYAATTHDNYGYSNKLIKVYEVKDILYQRWNNIVINYFGGTLDLFLNNELILSQINITPLLFPNQIICGSENGINGGIKSLKFYNKTLSKNDVNYIYYS